MQLVKPLTIRNLWARSVRNGLLRCFALHYGLELLTLNKDWDQPYSFFAPDYHVRGDDGYHRQIKGPVGTFLGVWYAHRLARRLFSVY